MMLGRKLVSVTEGLLVATPSFNECSSCNDPHCLNPKHQQFKQQLPELLVPQEVALLIRCLLSDLYESCEIEVNSVTHLYICLCNLDLQHMSSTSSLINTSDSLSNNTPPHYPSPNLCFKTY